MSTIVNKPVVTLVATRDLDAAARAELFEFCDRFSSRHQHRFDAQLAKDETVFLVRGSATGHLVGFGTLTVNEVTWQDEKAVVIYVGWTMISPEFRKHGIPQRLGFSAFLKQRLKHPLRNVYWMMTSSTLNSYLVLVRNFRDSYPQAGRRFPPRESAYVEQVLARLGSQWDPATGVVARGGVSFYREGRVDKEDVDQADPDIAFYITANPGQAEGDSLVCLAPLTLKNFAFIACRQLRRRKKAGAGRRRRQRAVPVTRLAASPGLRVACMCLLAFVVYGGWAFGVNYQHGFEVARAAGLAQGISSTISTLIITSIIELCFKWFRGKPGGLLLAWLVPPTLTGLMHAAFQWTVGTPEIFLTVLFSVVMGFLFAGSYLRGVVRLATT